VIRFENTNESQRIAAFPRALYYVTIERNPLAALSFATGALSWPDVVAKVIDRSANPAAFALGGSAEAVLTGDKVATLVFQAKATAGPSTAVADLVNAVNGASSYARVITVRRGDPLPGTSQGGADALAEERQRQQRAERERQAAEGPVAAIGQALRTGRNVLIIAVVVAAAVAAYRLFPDSARTSR